jgi:hypothetical protein
VGIRAVTVLEYRLIRNITANQIIALKDKQGSISPHDNLTKVKLHEFFKKFFKKNSCKGGQKQDTSNGTGQRIRFQLDTSFASKPGRALR